MQNYSLNSKVETITPELARIYLKSNTNNRPVSKITVNDYAAQMEKGLWKLNGEPIIIGRSGTILDGQHRLEAIVQSGVSVPMLLVFNVDDSAFTTIDTGRIRTGGDVLAIAGIENSQKKASIIVAYFNYKRQNLGFANKECLRKLQMSKTEVLDFYNQNSAVVDACVILAGRCCKHLRLLTFSIIGAYLLYLVLDKNHPIEKVQAFFEELHQLSPETNTTITLLRTALIKSATKQMILSPTLRNVYVMKTWNAFITGRTISCLKYNKEREKSVAFI